MSGHDLHDSHVAWHRMHPAARGLRIAGMVVLGVIAAGLFALAFGWLVMILWNWLMPTIFHLGEIGYWQAFGIVILAKLIFGGVNGARGPGRHRGPWRGNPWGGNPWEKQGRENWRWFHDYWEAEGREGLARFAEKRRAEAGTGDTGPKEA